MEEHALCFNFGAIAATELRERIVYRYVCACMSRYRERGAQLREAEVELTRVASRVFRFLGEIANQGKKND